MAQGLGAHPQRRPNEAETARWPGADTDMGTCVTLQYPYAALMKKSGPSQGPSIEDALGVLLSTAAPLLGALGANPSQDGLAVDRNADDPAGGGLSSGHRAVAVAAAALETSIVRGGQVPPPSTVGCSCVYIVRRSDGWFYCGETDNIAGMLWQQHSQCLWCFGCSIAVHVQAGWRRTGGRDG